MAVAAGGQRQGEFFPLPILAFAAHPESGQFLAEVLPSEYQYSSICSAEPAGPTALSAIHLDYARPLQLFGLLVRQESQEESSLDGARQGVGRLVQVVE